MTANEPVRRAVRCEHGFAKGVVTCDICDGTSRSRRPRPSVAYVLNIGAVVAGATVIELMAIEERARARAVCGCGQQFTVRVDNLRRKHREGSKARCPVCSRLARVNNGAEARDVR